MATKDEVRVLIKNALRELQPARNALKEATKPVIGVGRGTLPMGKCYSEVEKAASALHEALGWLE